MLRWYLGGRSNNFVMIMEKNVPFLFPYSHISTFPSFPWTLVDHMTLQAEMISVTCRFSPCPFCCQRYFPKRTIGAYYYSSNSSFSPLLPGWTLISPAGYKGLYHLLFCLPPGPSSFTHCFTVCHPQLPLIKSIWWIPTCISRIKPGPRFCTAVIETIIPVSVCPRFSRAVLLSFLLPQGSLLLKLPPSVTPPIGLPWWFSGGECTCQCRRIISCHLQDMDGPWGH